MSDAYDGWLGRVELRTLVKQTRLPVAACDANGRLTLLSPSLEKLFGQRFEPIPAAEYPARFRLVTSDGVTPMRPEDVPLTRACRGEVVRDEVICTRREEGALVYLRCNAAPLKGPDGSVVGALVLIQDVSADKVAADERAELRDRLMETINHEFRTPVTKMLGHAELLLDTDAPLAPGTRRSIEVIHEAAHELRALLDTVTRLIDLDSHTRVDKVSGDVVDLVRSIAADFGREFGSTRLTCAAPARMCATLDPMETRRAVWELLKNAAAYGPAGGPIALDVSGDDRTVRISVADTGTGIPSEQRERLVHPFERGTHPNQPVSSTGLGLAIAHAVAAAHGGRLELGDHPPHGLCARLVLPRYDEAPARVRGD